MKMVAEYLGLAHQFDRLAATETDPKVKRQFQEQAEAYYKLATKRAKDLGLAPPTPLVGAKATPDHG